MAGALASAIRWGVGAMIVVVLVAGMIGVYLSTFWIKSEDFWRPVHKAVVGAMAIVFIVAVVATCSGSLGRGGDPIIERNYR